MIKIISGKRKWTKTHTNKIELRAGFPARLKILPPSRPSPYLRSSVFISAGGFKCASL